MPDDDNDLAVVDSSGLTDRDWTKINELSAIYKAGGKQALAIALDTLTNEDPVLTLRVLAAFSPVDTSNAIKDVMADQGITEDDMRQLIAKLEQSDKKH